MKLFSNTIKGLEQSINLSAAKQKVISNNIANVDTPNYKAQEISFTQTLNSELGKMRAFKTNNKHIDFGSTSADFRITTNNSTYQQNGNNVDIDREMSEMAKNQIQYNALVDRLSSKFNSLQTVIKGGN